jgi:hypothetical protein
MEPAAADGLPKLPMGTAFRAIDDGQLDRFAPFDPDAGLRRPAEWTREQDLYVAVLLGAMKDLDDGPERYRIRAVGWFRGAAATVPFRMVCDALNLDRGRVRTLALRRAEVARVIIPRTPSTGFLLPLERIEASNEPVWLDFGT